MSTRFSYPSADPTRVSATIGEATTAQSIEDAHCALCGASLAGDRERYRMISPLAAMGAVTVCRACRRVASREGYRLAG
jgi:hypothetical protein